MRNRLWLHFLLLTVAGVAVSVGMLATTLHGRSPESGWAVALLAGLFQLPHDALVGLPVAAGIAVGTASAGPRGVRGAATLLASVVAIMFMMDLWVAPAAERALVDVARTAAARWPTPSDTLMPAPVEAHGALRSLATLTTSGFRGSAVTARTYARDHPRVVAVEALTGVGLFLLPFITLGLVLGVEAWVRRRVLFRSRRDELVATWALAWVIAPLGAGLLLSWSGGRQYGVLFRGAPLWSLLLPYAPFLLLATLGWSSAARAPERAELVAMSPTA